jgi:hypothetical protein
LALIPEAIAFSIIAGVDPKVGLYASFSIAVITAIVGGRPGMISAATAATAVLMITLVRDHGLEYLLAATVLAGLIQIAAGALRLGQARGVALLAVARAGLSVVEYNPMTIKQTVGAWGGADKAAVARMVKMLLGVAPAGPADVTDAVAIAICHHHHGRVSGAPAGVAR